MCGTEDEEDSATRDVVLGAADGAEGRLRQLKKAVLARERGIDIVVVLRDGELA